MNKTKILALVLVLALAVCAFAACGGNDQNAANQGGATSKGAASDTLIMGTEASFPPFEYIDDNAQVAGFDIELSNMIADAAGKKLQVENMDFGGLVAALQSGKIDFVAAGMTVTDEKKKNVDFSEPYFTSRQVIVVPADSAIASKDDLLGKIVAVQEGTTGEEMVREFKETDNGEPMDNTASFKNNADVAMEVINGRADAFVLDEEPAKAIVAQNEGKLKILDVEFGNENYAVAVKKGNTELLNIINGVIADIKANGTYDEMIAEYFPDRAEVGAEDAADVTDEADVPGTPADGEAADGTEAE